MLTFEKFYNIIVTLSDEDLAEFEDILNNFPIQPDVPEINDLFFDNIQLLS